jgi:bifunctional DNA-binding transcriptional regulator/antitoxin component of YhaV-PrlF toxin-antitoxin module
LGYKSTVVKADRKSPSVRVSIPAELAKELDIKPGDVLDWEPIDEKGRKMVKVKKLV